MYDLNDINPQNGKESKPIADWRKAGRGPPVDFFVQGRRVRESTRRESAPLHVIMIVFVDMHAGPV
jgi:hypothetical protein